MINDHDTCKLNCKSNASSARVLASARIMISCFSIQFLAKFNKRKKRNYLKLYAIL